MSEVLFCVLTVQILLGAFDNLWHHEITERLPARRSARGELALHTARELLYAPIFLALAWWQWHGPFAWLLGALLVVEIGVTLARRLPPLERALHTVLAVNAGILLALLAPVLAGWAARPAAVVAVDHGAWSWWLSASALGVLAWGVRDLIAVVRLGLPPAWQREPAPLPAADPARRILVTGATGFIGRRLCRHLLGRGDAVTVLSRDAVRAGDLLGPAVQVVESFDAIASGERIDAVVNLAGAPILGAPWTRRRRAHLLASRLDTTRAVVRLLRRLEHPPAVLVSASAVGFYGVTGDAVLDETATARRGFQSLLCRRWEAAALAAAPATRVCRLRRGLVLGRGGGALPSLLRPVRLGLGAVLGTGEQWMSWVHEEDVVRAVEFLIGTPGLHGPFNLCAPTPVRQRAFLHLAALRLGRRDGRAAGRRAAGRSPAPAGSRLPVPPRGAGWRAARSARGQAPARCRGPGPRAPAGARPGPRQPASREGSAS